MIAFEFFYEKMDSVFAKLIDTQAEDEYKLKHAVDEVLLQSACILIVLHQKLYLLE